MPNGPDKIIINHGGFNGRVAAINAEFEVLIHLGNEIIDLDLASTTNDDRDEMMIECEQVDEALDTYLEYLRKLIKKWANKIDNHKP